MTRTLARFTLVVFVLTLSIGAFAASRSADIRLYQDAQLNGTTLPAGYYMVNYDTTGSNAQVKFLKNGKEVASATGQVKQLTASPEYNQVVTRESNGGQAISEIDFNQGKIGVTFESSAMSSAGN